MASPSSMQNICANTKCGKVMDVPRKGWRCQGGNVYLCDQCFISFDLGQFCDIYHKNSTSWRSCKFCKKKFHVGCLASRHLYFNLETRGIRCIDCEPSDTVPPPNSITDQQNVSEPHPERSTHQRLASKDMGKKPISKGTTNKSTSTRVAIVPATIVANDEENVSEQFTPSSSTLEYQRNKTNTKAQASSRKLHMGRYEKNESYRYTPRMTDDEFKVISKSANAEITFLFEKRLTKSDAGDIGRFIVPKKCAEDFFPPLDEPKGQAIIIQDTRGRDWRFHFRYWENAGSRIYVIEGFKPFVEEMNLCRGDVVTFSQLEPGGKLVMGHGKATSTTSPANKMPKTGMDTPSRSRRVSKRKSRSARRKSIKGSSTSKAKMESDTDPEEIELITGYLENGTSSPSSGEGSLFRNAEAAFPYSKKPKKGTVTKGIIIGHSKGNVTSARPSMFGIGQVNDKISAASDHKGKAKLVPVRGKRKSCGIEIDLRCKSAENEKKNKWTKKAKRSILEPGPSRQVVPRIENVITALPEQSKATKKHPRHKPGCVCVVCNPHIISCLCTRCVKRHRGKKGSKTGHKKSMGQPSNIQNPSDQPGTSQINYQMTVNQNANSLSGSDSKILPFDLNDLPPESDEEL